MWIETWLGEKGIESTFLCECFSSMDVDWQMDLALSVIHHTTNPPQKKHQKTNPNKQKTNTNDKEEMAALNLQLPEFTRCALRLDTKANPCRGQENRQNQQLVPAFQSVLGRTYAQDFSNGGNSRHAQRHRSLCLGNVNLNREVSLGTSSIRQPPSGNVLDCNLKHR